MITRWRGRVSEQGGAIIAGMLVIIAAIFLEAAIAPTADHAIRIGSGDLGVVRGWSAKEQSATLPGASGGAPRPYRWSGGRSQLVFEPVVAGQAQIVTVGLLGGRPGGAVVAPVHWSIDGRRLATLDIGPSLRTYHILVPGELVRRATLALVIDTPTFVPPDDEHRELGLIGTTATRRGIAPAVLAPRFSLAVLAVLAGMLAWLLGGRSHAVWLTLAGVVAIGVLALLAWPWPAFAALRSAAVLACWTLGGVLAWLLWRRWRHRLPARRLAVAGVTLLTLLTLAPVIDADGVEYYAWLRSPAVDGDLEFTNEYLAPEVPFGHIPTWLAGARTATDHAQNLASVGPALVWAPFYLLGEALTRIGIVLGEPWRTDGYAPPYLLMIDLAGMVVGLAAVRYSMLLAQRAAGRPMATLAAIGLCAGSAIIYFALFESYYAHILSAALVAAFAWYWHVTRQARTVWQWAVLGGLAGAMCLAYWVNALVMLLPAIDALAAGIDALRRRDGRGVARTIAHGILFLGTCLLAFTPQMLAWQIVYGTPLTIPHGGGFAGPGGFKAIEMFLSPLHGQVWWAPLSIVALIGAVGYARRDRAGWWLLLTFALYFSYNATLSSWHGGGPFGLRRVVNVLPLLAPGMGWALDWLARRSPIAPVAVLSAGLAWQAGLMIRFLVYAIPHHPGELNRLGVAEFLFASDNLPYGELERIISTGWFGRQFAEAISVGDAAQRTLLVLIAGCTALVIWGAQRIGWRERDAP